jgi:ABC-type antimicrobial peptide transport system permease subunit/outer membrane protein assembly factor BamB
LEVARTPQPMGGDVIYRGVAFDALNELVYVTVSPLADSSQHTGALIALDARTLVQKWSFSTAGGADSAPVLSGTQLCFGDRTSTIYMFDTRAALAQGENGQTPTPKWQCAVPAPQAWTNTPNPRVAAPLLANGQVYASVWYFSAETANAPKATHYLYLAQCNAKDGSAPQVAQLYSTTHPAVVIDQVLTPPVQVQGNFASTLAPALAFNAVDAIVLADPAGKLAARTYTLPNAASNQIYTGIAVDPASALAQGSPALWFADKTATLSVLGNDLGLLNSYKASQRVGPYVSTTPILYKDSTGTLTVVYGLVDTLNAAGYLYGLDPASGEVLSVPTGLTQITTLTQDQTNGVVYAAGADLDPSGNAANRIAQVFGIRVDDWPQTLRDFITDSQLMTDYDDSSPGQPFPRYQTHLTVVDDQKNAQPHAALKIWADQPNTSITVDGQPYTIGPGDSDFAQVKTGIDGAIAIASEATDYFASPLRVWASFMDPYERIVVYPDQEFHVRVTTAHADANDTDPDKVNLMTASAYSGKPLFTDDEKQADQPQKIAQSIHQVSQAIHVNGSGSSTAAAFEQVMRSVSPLHANTRRAAAPPPNDYLAYDDLAGAAHFFTNVSAARPLAIAQPTGAAYWISDPRDPNAPPSTYPTFVALSPAEARDAIDALTGQPWDAERDLSPQARSSRRVGNIFTDFWNWLKKAFSTITHIIVSLAEDVMVGIGYIFQGIAKVFKAVLKILADVFPFLGSFFKMLEKVIDDVVEALSVLLDFGEIMKTQVWLVQQVNQQVTNLKAAITDTIQPNIDKFFAQGEGAIKGFFDRLRQKLDPNAGLADMKGMGATPHTTFTVGPAGGQASSHATQCAWPMQKLKTGLASASTPSLLAGQRRSCVGDSDPLSDFFNTFIARITGDGDLSAAFAQLQSDFSNLFHAGSAREFFSTLLVTLIDAIETLLIGALAVGNAFIDGMLAVIEDLIDTVMGLLNAEIQIPVLTDLYESLTGESLTFLNLITLVGAIPATIIYKVVTGDFPSQDFPPAGSEAPCATGQGVRVGASPVAALVLGVLNGLATLVAGIVNGISDAEGDEAAPILGYVALGLGAIGAAFSFPLIGSDNPSTDDWAVYGVSLGILYWGCWSVLLPGSAGPVVSVVYAVLNVGLLAATIVAFVNDGQFDPTANAAFAGGIIGAVDGIVNPGKLAPQPAPVVVGAVDVVAGLVGGAIDIGVALANASS